MSLPKPENMVMRYRQHPIIQVILVAIETFVVLVSLRLVLEAERTKCLLHFRNDLRSLHCESVV